MTDKRVPLNASGLNVLSHLLVPLHRVRLCVSFKADLANLPGLHPMIVIKQDMMVSAAARTSANRYVLICMDMWVAANLDQLWHNIRRVAMDDYESGPPCFEACVKILQAIK